MYTFARFLASQSKKSRVRRHKISWGKATLYQFQFTISRIGKRGFHHWIITKNITTNWMLPHKVNLWLLHPQSRCMYHYFMLNLSSLHKGVKLSFHSSVLWSFPLHCWWRFGCDVINHSINTSHTVADFGRHHGKKLPIKVIPASKEQNKVS